MQGRLPYAIALLLSGCTIQRDVPLDRFACSNGGPCDGGVTPPMDGTFPDATPDKDVPIEDVPDVGGVDVGPDGGEPPPDTGIPLAACPKIQPLMSGLVGGDTTNEVNSYEPGCSAPGGRDLVFGFNIPGMLRELTISTGGSMFDTALHLYRDDCTPVNRITCNDEADNYEMGLLRSSIIELEDVAPGDYAIVLDAFGPVEAGMFQLSVNGKLAPGEPCDPAQTYLACQIGTCGGSPPRCPEVLDCAGDSIDADDDGATDEDTCTDPPVVNCTQVATPYVNDPVDLTATVLQAPIYRQWRVTERPFGSVDDPLQPNQDTSMFYSDLAGSYRIRYRAADAMFQLSACEVTFTTEHEDAIRVELVWNGDLPQHEHHSFLGMHLLHPNAQRWFDTTLDCWTAECLYRARDWNQQGQQIDDPFLVGLILGPQWVSVYQGQLNGTYGIGIGYEFDNFRPSTAALINVYCYGFLEQTLTASLVVGDGFPDDNDFWKVAEVDLNSGGCQVIPYLNGSDPLIVTGSDARNAR